MFEKTWCLGNYPTEKLEMVWLLINRLSGYVLMAFCDDPAWIAFSFC